MHVQKTLLSILVSFMRWRIGAEHQYLPHFRITKRCPVRSPFKTTFEIPLKRDQYRRKALHRPDAAEIHAVVRACEIVCLEQRFVEQCVKKGVYFDTYIYLHMSLVR